MSVLGAATYIHRLLLADSAPADVRNTLHDLDNDVPTSYLRLVSNLQGSQLTRTIEELEY